VEKKRVLSGRDAGVVIEKNASNLIRSSSEIFEDLSHALDPLENSPSRDSLESSQTKPQNASSLALSKHAAFWKNCLNAICPTAPPMVDPL